MAFKSAEKLNRLNGLRGLQGVQQIARYRCSVLPGLSVIPITRTVQDIARLSGNSMHEGCKIHCVSVDASGILDVHLVQ